MYSDMIAHNHDRERDIFQFTGNDPGSMCWHTRRIWPMRFGTNPFPTGTNANGGTVCHAAAAVRTAPPFPRWLRFSSCPAHVRVTSDPRSTLFNTDGQIFSDAGVPCVLFMENYDINRTGYHDTHDTMENIDLGLRRGRVRHHHRKRVARAANATDVPL